MDLKTFNIAGVSYNHSWNWWSRRIKLPVHHLHQTQAPQGANGRESFHYTVGGGGGGSSSSAGANGGSGGGGGQNATGGLGIL